MRGFKHASPVDFPMAFQQCQLYQISGQWEFSVSLNCYWDSDIGKGASETFLLFAVFATSGLVCLQHTWWVWMSHFFPSLHSPLALLSQCIFTVTPAIFQPRGFEFLSLPTYGMQAILFIFSHWNTASVSRNKTFSFAPVTRPVVRFQCCLPSSFLICKVKRISEMVSCIFFSSSGISEVLY